MWFYKVVSTTKTSNISHTSQAMCGLEILRKMKELCKKGGSMHDYKPDCVF